MIATTHFPFRVVLVINCLAGIIWADDKPRPFEQAKEQFVKKIQDALGDKNRGRETAIAILIKDSRALAKAHPQESQAWDFVLQSTEFINDAKQKTATLEELTKISGKGEGFSLIRKTATGRLWLLSKPLGKPLDIKFTALDNRKVDLAKLKGKVVLIDFWATWCGPCIQILPKVKATYQKLHKDGFEIIGISLDDNRAALDKFVDKEKLPWPQYFSAKGAESDLVLHHGVGEIPTMWLVDKHGKLVDMNVHDDLTAKVKRLLAEK